MSCPSRPENWKPLDEQPTLRHDWASLADAAAWIAVILLVLWVVVKIADWMLP